MDKEKTNKTECEHFRNYDPTNEKCKDCIVIAFCKKETKLQREFEKNKGKLGEDPRMQSPGPTS